MVRAALLVLSILFILVGCRQEPPIQGEEAKADYFPLTEGDRWVYVGGLAGSFADTIIYEVAGTETHSTQKLAWKIWRRWNGPERTSVDSFYVAKNTEKVLLYTDWIDTIPDVFLKLPLADGVSWSEITGGMTTDPRKPPTNVVRTFTVTYVDTVTIFDKTYKKCFKVEAQEKAPDVTFMSTYDWYAPNVGRVQSVMQTPVRLFEMKLIDHKVH